LHAIEGRAYVVVEIDRLVFREKVPNKGVRLEELELVCKSRPGGFEERIEDIGHGDNTGASVEANAVNELGTCLATDGR
jgi:hypothetical protein